MGWGVIFWQKYAMFFNVPLLKLEIAVRVPTQKYEVISQRKNKR